MVLISPELAWEMPKAAGIACEITSKRTDDGEEEAVMPADESCADWWLADRCVSKNIITEKSQS